MTACLLGGCSKESAEQTEITLIHGWGSMESEHVRMRQIYKDFEKEHPEIKLNLMSMTSSDEVIKRQKHAFCWRGSGSDFYRRLRKRFGVPLYGRKKQSGRPYALSGERSGICRLCSAGDHFPTGRRTGSCIPCQIVLLLGGGYWYNADIFEKAGIESVPETWDEFLEACEKIQSWSQNEGKSVIPVQITKENSAYLADALLFGHFQRSTGRSGKSFDDAKCKRTFSGFRDNEADQTIWGQYRQKLWIQGRRKYVQQWKYSHVYQWSVGK